MLKPQILGAAALALLVTACGSDPVSYSEPRYVSGSSYRNGAYSDEGRVVAIDVVRGSGGSPGAGAVVGGLVGGVLGHQIGSGRGNTAATVAGAVCVYLLLGELFAMVFGLLSTLESGRFFASTSNPTTVDYVYFSYSTLSTVGYGDLVAKTGLGRMLAGCEALMGQVYLVTVIAVIVGNLGRPGRRRTQLGGEE